MTTITRRMEFDAAHRVLGHEGKCRHLHGHRYVVEITVRAPQLDDLGRVVDFSVVKEKVGGWIDRVLDHNALLHPEDPLLLVDNGRFGSLCGREPFLMPEDAPNPTAENIAFVIHGRAVGLLEDYGLDVVGVRVYETPNCHADYPG